MSLNLNQRIYAFKKNAVEHRTPSLAFKWPVLAIALTAVIYSQSAAAEALLDVNHA